MTGKELKAFRQRLGLTQAEFGRRLGYKRPQPTVSDLERERQKINSRIEVSIQMWKKNMGLQAYAKELK